MKSTSTKLLHVLTLGDQAQEYNTPLTFHSLLFSVNR